MKLELSWQIFEKFSNTNLNKIRRVGAQLLQADRQTDGRKDRFDEGNNRLSQCFESA